MDFNTIAKDIWELNGKMEWITRVLWKVETAIENQNTITQGQNVANKRILSLEKKDIKIEDRLIDLEKWQIKVIAYSSIIATVVWFIFHKIF